MLEVLRRFEIPLILLIWLIGGYFAGIFIINWNKKYQNDFAKLTIANNLNVNLNLEKTNVLVWKILLTVMGFITVFKVIILRIRGEKA